MKTKFKKSNIISILLVTLILLGTVAGIFSLAAETTIYKSENYKLGETYKDDNKLIASLPKNSNKFKYVARDISTYKNMYCVQHDRPLETKINTQESIEFTAISKVEIIGNVAKYYKVNSDGSTTPLKNSAGNDLIITDKMNNIFAGILLEEDIYFDNGEKTCTWVKKAEKDENGNYLKDEDGNYIVIEEKQIPYSESIPYICPWCKNEHSEVYKGYGGMTQSKNDDGNTVYSVDYTITQMAVYRYYSKWLDTATGEATGFERYEYCSVSSYEQWTPKTIIAEVYKEEVAKKAQNQKYCATIYFLDVIEKDEGITAKDGVQNAIIVEPLEVMDIPVQKVWNDNGNENGNRPESIEVELYANDQATGKKLTLNAGNNWSGEFTELNINDENGKAITYTVKEISTPIGYKTPVITGNTTTGFTITNTLETINIPVQKIWKDNSNKGGNRPTSIQVELYADGVATGKKLTLTAPEWKQQKFTNLPKYKNGKEIKYTVKEILENGKAEDYITTITGDQSSFIITNELNKTEVPVKKVWQGSTSNLPKFIKVQLYANGKPTDKTLILNKENNWSDKFTDLEIFDENKKTITYTVKEVFEDGKEKDYETTITGDQKTGFTITNISYTGYTEIKGKVWIDERDGKSNDINGRLDNDEKGLRGIKVTLKYIDANGKSQIFNPNKTSAYTTKTDANGNYVIRVNYDNTKNVYKLYEDETTVNKKLETAYIEFEYDGLKYTTVANTKTGADTSKATENEGERTTLDNKYSTIVPSTNINTWTEKNITAKTENITSYETTTRKSEETIWYCNADGKTYTYTNPNGAWLDIQDGEYECNCAGAGHSLKTINVQVNEIININLGLFEREQPSIGLTLDLSKVEVNMDKSANDYKYTYLYGNKYNNKNLEQIKEIQKSVNLYERPMNIADIAYVNKNTDTAKLDLHAIYEVNLKDYSSTLGLTIRNIINSYDNNYEIEDIIKGKMNKQTGEIDGKSIFTEIRVTEEAVSENKYKQVSIDLGEHAIKVNSGSSSIESIFIKYTLSEDSKFIDTLINSENILLNNAVEVGTYTTTYGEKTLYAEQRMGQRTGNPYAGYDIESHPGNAGIYINNESQFVAEKLEYDTDITPLKLTTTSKKLSGMVWEDSQTQESKDNSERLGNGLYDEGENKVQNVKVELYNTDGTLAELYDKDTKQWIKAEAYTNSEGNFDFNGVVTGEYYTKYTYGNNTENATTMDGGTTTLNARNYKSTIIKDSEVEKVVRNQNLGFADMTWILNHNDGYSIAVDNIEDREKFGNLIYGNFDEKLNISAQTPKFTTLLEFEPNGYSQVNADGTGISNDLNKLDFGIIERPRENLFVETTTTHIELTNGLSQKVLEGNPKDVIDYVKALGYNQNINSGESARNALAKQKIVEIDTELIQNSQFNITYEIKVTNNSEINYASNDYYYFGTVQAGEQPIKASVNKLVSYMDKDIEYKYSDNWTKYEVDQLRDDTNSTQALISGVTKDTLKNGNEYVAYVTETYKDLAPGESKSETITANKLLSNNNENAFETHAEIIEIDSQIARTTKGTENGTQLTKQYKPGNYVPSTEKRQININGIAPEALGYHEQDDDIDKTVVTPGTGVTKYVTTYIWTGLIGLILIVIGVVFIKKKVL